MLLRTKFSLIFTLLFVLFAGKDFIANRALILPTFFELERYHAMMRLSLCKRMIQREIGHLDRVCQGLAANGLENLAKRTKISPGEADIPFGFFKDNDIDLIYLFDSQGKLEYGSIYNSRTGRPMVLSKSPGESSPDGVGLGPLPQKKGGGHFQFSGVVPTEQGPLMIAARHLQSAESSDLKTLVLGRFLNESFVRSTGEQFRMNFEIHPLGLRQMGNGIDVITNLKPENFPHFVNNEPENVLVAYEPFLDINGKQVFLISLTIPRTISTVGTGTLNFALLISLTAGLIVIILILTLVEKAVLTPLKKLTEHTQTVVTTGDLSARLRLDRKDETGILAEKFDSMLETLENRTKELGDSEERYRLFVEGASDAIFITGKDGRFVFVNEAASVLTGFEKTEIESKHFYDLLENGDRLFADEFERVAEGVSVSEAVIVRKDGKKIDAEFSNRKIQIHDTPYLHTVARNITSRKKMEQTLFEREKYYRSLLFSMQDNVIVIDANYRITDMNKNYFDILGMDREAVIGKYCFEVFVGFGELLDRRGGKSLLMKVFETGKLENVRAVHRLSDGSEAWTDIQISPLEDETGDISRLMIVLRDTTKEMVLGNQLRQSQKMEAIGTLAGGIAHDFNNILMTIMINTEFAIEELEPDHPTRESLEMSLEAGKRARDLVNQILTFSRKTEAKATPLPISPILKESLKMLRSTIPATIEIEQNIAAEFDTVVASPAQINQIMFNLCANAAFAMKDTGGLLSVSLTEDICPETTERKETRRCLRLTVRDTGHGIPPELTERIFDPFFTTKNPGEGTGMGLSVIHGILSEIGGSIRVSSKPGKGAEFDVFLPLAKSAGTSAIPSERPTPSGTGRLLLVDDETYLVTSLEKSLTKYGFSVHSETRPAKALEIFEKNPDGFDLVITDLTMPEMTGRELAENLRRIRPDIPVILCSGFSEEVESPHIRKTVKKPVIASELSEIVNDILEQLSVISYQL